jgi:hypothetical protein
MSPGKRAKDSVRLFNSYYQNLKWGVCWFQKYFTAARSGSYSHPRGQARGIIVFPLTMNNQQRTPLPSRVGGISVSFFKEILYLALTLATRSTEFQNLE